MPSWRAGCAPPSTLPDDLCRARCQFLAVLTAGAGQRWPSVSVSSWKRPLLSTSQMSRYLVPPMRLGAGSGEACADHLAHALGDVGRVAGRADHVHVAHVAGGVEIDLGNDDGVDQRRQLALVDLVAVGRVDVARAVLAVGLGVGRRRGVGCRRDRRGRAGPAGRRQQGGGKRELHGRSPAQWVKPLCLPAIRRGGAEITPRAAASIVTQQVTGSACGGPAACG